jgi:hypothetical protein
MSTITEAEALSLFPELRELITIRRVGWVFRPVGNREAQDLVGIVGSYTRRRYTDALWIYDRTTVIGVRVLQADYGGGCVWRKDDGGLVDVVQELLALPEPDDRLAPKLVKPRLWTPR